MISTPTHVVNSEAAQFPLQIRRQFIADKYILKIKSLTNHPLVGKLQSLNSEIEFNSYWANKSIPVLVVSFNRYKNLEVEQYDKLPAFLENYELCKLKVEVDISTFDKNWSDLQIRSTVYEKLKSTNYDWIIFTDGSINKENKCSGYAFYNQTMKDPCEVSP